MVPSVMHWPELGAQCTCVLFKYHRWRVYQYFFLMIHNNISQLFSSPSCTGILTVATIRRLPTQPLRRSTSLEIVVVELPVLNIRCEPHPSLDSKRSSSLRSPPSQAWMCGGVSAPRSQPWTSRTPTSVSPSGSSSICRGSYRSGSVPNSSPNNKPHTYQLDKCSHFFWSKAFPLVSCRGMIGSSVTRVRCRWRRAGGLERHFEPGVEDLDGGFRQGGLARDDEQRFELGVEDPSSTVERIGRKRCYCSVSYLIRVTIDHRSSPLDRLGAWCTILKVGHSKMRLVMIIVKRSIIRTHVLYYLKGTTCLQYI